MISRSSVIASSAPPTSLNVTPTSSGFTSVALLLPTPKMPPPNMPPPVRAARLRPASDQSPIMTTIGRTQLRMKVAIGLGGVLARYVTCAAPSCDQIRLPSGGGRVANRVVACPGV